jgi:hypothetical protein
MAEARRGRIDHVEFKEILATAASNMHTAHSTARAPLQPSTAAPTGAQNLAAAVRIKDVG